MSRGILKKFYFFVGTLILCILGGMFGRWILDLKQCSWFTLLELLGTGIGRWQR